MKSSTLRTNKADLFLSTSLDTALCILAIAGLIFVPVIGSLGAMLFIGSGLLIMLRHMNQSANQLVRFWYLLLLPLFCTVSFLWSQYPGISFRFGLQLSITVVIAIIVANRIPARTFILAHFALFAVAMIASIVFPDPKGQAAAWSGIYGSKNALAGATAVFIVIAFGLAVDRAASVRFRVFAGLWIGVALIPLVFAQSVSAIMIIPPTVAILLGILLAPGISPLRQVVVLIYGLLFFALAGLLFLINIEQLTNWFLDTTGKDFTLTGRTDLWNIALSFIAERPVFGMGYQAFWVPGHQPAEALWFLFGIGNRSGFSFHNTYLSNAVEIGILGVAIQVFVLFGAAYLTGKWALQRQSADAALLFALVMMVVLISFIEVPIFFQFSSRTLIVFCAFVYGVRALAGPNRQA